MKKKLLYSILIIMSSSILIFSCQKEYGKESNLPKEEKILSEDHNANQANPPYNLNVVLRGLSNQSGENEEDDQEESGDDDDNASGILKFRQDPDPAKIITLDIKVHKLLPNHEYLLQRAVDPINVVDGNCTSTTWLTLGKGLVPQSIFTDSHGKGKEALWRDITAAPTGASFDIHFQVVDKLSNAVVLTSDCYQYQVR